MKSTIWCLVHDYIFVNPEFCSQNYWEWLISWRMLQSIYLWPCMLQQLINYICNCKIMWMIQSSFTLYWVISFPFMARNVFLPFPFFSFSKCFLIRFLVVLYSVAIKSKESGAYTLIIESPLLYLTACRVLYQEQSSIRHHPHTDWVLRYIAASDVI